MTIRLVVALFPFTSRLPFFMECKVWFGLCVFYDLKYIPGTWDVNAIYLALAHEFLLEGSAFNSLTESFQRRVKKSKDSLSKCHKRNLTIVRDSHTLPRPQLWQTPSFKLYTTCLEFCLEFRHPDMTRKRVFIRASKRENYIIAPVCHVLHAFYNLVCALYKIR